MAPRQGIITGWRPPTCMAPRSGGMLTIIDPQGLKESSSLKASKVKKTSLTPLSGALRVILSLKSNSGLLVIIGKKWNGNKRFWEDTFFCI